MGNVFPRCAFCAEEGVVLVNGTSACIEHIDDAMKPVSRIMQLVRRLAANGDD